MTPPCPDCGADSFVVAAEGDLIVYECVEGHEFNERGCRANDMSDDTRCDDCQPCPDCNCGQCPVCLEPVPVGPTTP